VAKILVVDDEKMICEEFRGLLEEDHHQVDIALGGEEAIQKVKDTHYDLVFLDVLMPRMEGREVLDQIKKVSKAAVVIMSGYLPPNKEKEVKSLGAAACFSKPLELNRVREFIRSFEAEKK